MALGHSLGPEGTMASGDSSDLPGLHGSGGSLTLKDQQCFRGWPRPYTSALPSVAMGAMDINSEPGHSWAMESDMAPGSSPGWQLRPPESAWPHGAEWQCRPFR